MTEVKPIRWLITGARMVSPDEAAYVRRTLTDYFHSWLMLFEARPLIIVQGECSTGGVDLVARRWAEETNGVNSEGYPASWKADGKAAGMIRNSLMVKRGADLCLAFPTTGSRGTWDCLQKAVNAGIPSHLHQLNIDLKDQS